MESPFENAEGVIGIWYQFFRDHFRTGKTFAAVPPFRSRNETCREAKKAFTRIKHKNIKIKIMLQINILYVGNIKDKFFAQAVEEYEKRLSKTCKIKNIELKEEKPKDESDSEIALVIKKEGDRLLEAIPQKSYKIALCVEGKQISSEELAEKIESVTVSGYSEITFIIGGAFGMDERVKKLADMRLSISKMTFTHRMMRVILIEQIYRAENILSGGNYHK